MEDEQATLLTRARQMLEQGQLAELGDLISDEHPVDIAALLETLEPEQRVAVFSLLDNETAAQVMDELHAEARDDLLDRLSPEKTSDIVEEMPSDEAADLLGDMPREEARQILDLMPEAEAERVKELLQYPEHTAGGQMATEVLTMPADLTVDEAIARLRRLEPEVETIYYIYVVGPEERLDGVISLRELLVAEPTLRLREIMERDVITVPPEMDQEEVARLVGRYDLLAVPVVDEERRLLGIVTIDDVADVVEQEATEDILGVSGAAPPEAEAATSALGSLLLGRSPALAVVAAGGLVAAVVVRALADGLGLPLALATFVPLVVLVAAGVANQSAALMIKEFASERTDAAALGRSAWREIRVGVLLAITAGVVTALLCRTLYHFGLCLVIGVAVAGNVLAAVIIGTSLPLLLAKVGADPSRAASPLVSAAADLAALAIYLALGGGLSHLLS